MIGISDRDLIIKNCMASLRSNLHTSDRQVLTVAGKIEAKQALNDSPIRKIIYMIKSGEKNKIPSPLLHSSRRGAEK